MDRTTREPQENPEERFEDLHRSYFQRPDDHLSRLFTIHRERRVLRERAIGTVVTYGAYEDPI